ncbi:MAG: hypothetical protein ABGZ36_17715 [Actinomycetota bacterium]|jgi:hypothetical protein|uniref:hypothetical protein n=1 Tax=Euzebya pacifica TaxID=1608957 RepID=UPI0013DF94CD|nr:hypothetical protein [Euzebya pacifica]
MSEVLWVTVLGAVLAWLQANSGPDEQLEQVEVPIDDEWERWEAEIHDWKDLR